MIALFISPPKHLSVECRFGSFALRAPSLLTCDRFDSCAFVWPARPPAPLLLDFRTCPAPLLLWTFARVRSVCLLLCLVVVLCEGVLGCPPRYHRAP